ncbi:MAG TPA: hypothetical protein VJS92_04425 [Candidatus Polarisedimenticolaceae bacterium]|nr:hypothetical protein [Candidatus Polarisedimenticolaceae bacterium]
MTRVRMALAVGCLALIPLGARAAEPETPWYVTLQGGFTQVGNDDLLLGTPASPTTGGPSGELATIGFDPEASLRIGFGYSGPDWDWELAAWRLEAQSNETVTSADGLLPAFSDPLFGDTLANRLDGEAELDATVVDCAWGRRLGSTARSHWTWVVGLRSSRIAQDSTMTSDADGAGGFDDRVKISSTARGVGVVGGIAVRYLWSDRVWGTSSLRLALLTGSLDVERSEDAFGDLLVTRLDGADRTFRQGELDVRANFRVAHHLVLFAGYEFRLYDGGVARLVPTDDVANGVLVEEAADVGFSGLAAGVTFEF